MNRHRLAGREPCRPGPGRVLAPGRRPAVHVVLPGQPVPPLAGLAGLAGLFGLFGGDVTRTPQAGASGFGPGNAPDVGSGRPGARFRIGSVTKVCTATVVPQLAAERRIDLAAPFQRYLSVTRNGTTRLVDVTNWNQSITPASVTWSRQWPTWTPSPGRCSAAGCSRPAQLAEMFTRPPVDDVAGGPAQHSAGLTAFPLPNGEVLWAKSGARYGYSAAIAASEDGRFRAAYSVTSTDAKGDGRNAVTDAITQAMLGLR
ncbi:serine hydrolase [Micromonospora sp. WMMD1102]|uniref:serine hydrolase n=1 Tax=Micromonospora sp. WMMD1102 TaxID=3016105 RepID=UPI002414E791|nr:serine hydrolase [Micromonospora sp. WMMD1102]MDG4790682.1 serine hydrolase [Micromonospora sp. WMMD1102]